jgi:hypothetical protein
MGKKSGSGMNNPDHISEGLETNFWVKILIFFDAYPGSGIQDPGSEMEKIRIQDEGSGINILDTQHCFLLQFIKEYIALK